MKESIESSQNLSASTLLQGQVVLITGASRGIGAATALLLSVALTIFNVSSHEQLLKYLYENPISPHVAFLITPLVPDNVFDDENITSYVHKAYESSLILQEEERRGKRG